ncbi:MAG: hypothetical protein KC464_17195, partial [Myxococcales bacterium]|nr:hypothetical protein [Myxococcales bacterium]
MPTDTSPPRVAIGPDLDEGTVVQDTRQVVGNCALWWAKDRAGYVCDLRDAGVYTGAEAAAMRD